MLSGTQTRIQNWWAQANDGVLGERFRLEAQASLPLVGGGAGVEEVYAGVRVQRLRLRFEIANTVVKSPAERSWLFDSP